MMPRRRHGSRRRGFIPFAVTPAGPCRASSLGRAHRKKRENPTSSRGCLCVDNASINTRGTWNRRTWLHEPFNFLYAAHSPRPIYIRIRTICCSFIPSSSFCSHSFGLHTSSAHTSKAYLCPQPFCVCCLGCGCVQTDCCYYFSSRFEVS